MSQQTQLLILGNEIDSDGWALIVPYGEHPKERMARVDGRVQRQKFLQVLDNDSADRLVGKENSLFGRIKRAAIGISVWKGHPDLPDHSPETLGNAGSRLKLGTISKVRKTERGIEAKFVLDNDGVKAVSEGYKFPSALWLVLPNGQTKDGATVCHPVKLLSVGLTDRPNISGVESLANAGDAGVQKSEPPMKLIAGWLIAQGLVLSNAAEPTEAEVLTALTKWKSDQAGQMTTLGNEKSTQAGQITTLTNERDQLKTQVSTLTTAKTTAETALANEQSARKSERAGRIGALVDLAITRGKARMADRQAKIDALANCADDAAFKTASEALLNGATVVKTIGGDNTGSVKVLGNDGTDAADVDPRDAYMDAVKKHMADTGETDLGKAMKAVKTQCPQLHQALLGRKAA